MEATEEYEAKITAIRDALIAGENSGISTNLDMSSIIKDAKLEAGLI